MTLIQDEMRQKHPFSGTKSTFHSGEISKYTWVKFKKLQPLFPSNLLDFLSPKVPLQNW